MKILVGPFTPLAGSHLGLTRHIPGAVRFETDLAGAVAREKPDLVLLRAAGHNGLDPRDIAECPVPVVGLYHDWPCWGSARLDAVARNVDWLITEKSAARYLDHSRPAGERRHSAWLLMSKYGIERVRESGIERAARAEIDAAFLGSFVINGTRNPYRMHADDPITLNDNLYWSRLGFRERSVALATIAAHHGPVYLAARTRNRPGLVLNEEFPSFDVTARSLISVHLDAGRAYAANRCFEVLALGSLLFLEAGNELLDHLPDGTAIAFTPATLGEEIARWSARPHEARERADAARAHALEAFTNERMIEGMVREIETHWEAIRAAASHRLIGLENWRAPVHWEGAERHHGAATDRLLAAVADTPIGANEAAFDAFDRYRKTGDQTLLEQAAGAAERAGVMADGHAVVHWNRAVIALEQGDRQRADHALQAAADAAASARFDWQGSRLEIHRPGWMSGTIEHPLAIAKITGDHRALEAAAMRWRIGMLTGDRAIHWPSLPDEHARNGDLETACRLDPLLRPSTVLAERIEDLRADAE